MLVTYNKYFNTPLGIRNLANLRIQFNCDILYQNINPLSVKNITRTTLRNYGSIYWPILAGQTVFHFHCHIIPRYKGDVENPRGGVRNVILGKGDY